MSDMDWKPLPQMNESFKDRMAEIEKTMLEIFTLVNIPPKARSE